MTKKIVTISLFIFFVLVVSISVAALINYDNRSTAPIPGSVGQSIIRLSTTTIAKHDLSSDCWVIVQDGVYDLTKFIDKHSGGSKEIISFCGKDGTNAFLTKNQNPAEPHKSGDLSILSVYKIGNLNQDINTIDVQQKTQNISDTNQIQKNRDDDDEDDD